MERRLPEPGFAREARRHPVAGFGHVARDPGVARLVRTDESDCPQMAEVANEKSRADQHGPADASREALSLFLRSNFGRRGHERAGLTLVRRTVRPKDTCV